MEIGGDRRTDRADGRKIFTFHYVFRGSQLARVANAKNVKGSSLCPFVSSRLVDRRGQGAGGRGGEARIREDCAIPVGTIGNGVLPVGPKSLDCFGFSEISERLGFQGLMTR